MILKDKITYWLKSYYDTNDLESCQDERAKVIDDIKKRKATGKPPTQKEAKEALDFLKDFTKDYKG